MSGRLARKLGLMGAIRSVPLGPLLRRAATFPADYHLGSGRSGRPLNVTLDLSFRCNLSCSFCFNGETNRADSGGIELGLSAIEAIVREATGWASSFYLTGGEPLLRDDLARIVSSIRTAGLVCGISTNGTLLTPERAEALIRAGTSYLIVSPHAHDAGEGGGREIEAVESLAGRSGSMRLLLNFVLDGRNSRRLVETIRLAEAARADAVCVQHLTFLTPEERHRHAAALASTVGNGQEPLAIGPPGVTSDDVERLLADCDRVRREARVPVFFKPDLSEDETRRWYLGGYRPTGTCSFPWTDVRVHPDGSIPFCQFIPIEVGNALSPGLRASWNGEPYRALRRALRKAGGTLPACARCCKLYRSPR